MECDDVLVPVGQEAKITARLGLTPVWAGLRMRFKFRGMLVTFCVDGREVGRATSRGWLGRSKITFTPPLEKEYCVVATYRSGATSRTASARATIFSRSTERKAIVLDIDRTLSASSTFGSIFRRNKRIPPLKDAVDVTNALARSYDLIIVTGRKSYLRRKTKRWLAEKGFPRTPVYFSSFFKSPLSHQRFKTELIRRLRTTWTNIAIGIGDTDSDAMAYLENGLTAIILRQKGRCPPPARGTLRPGVIMVSSWREIRRILLSDPCGGEPLRGERFEEGE